MSDERPSLPRIFISYRREDSAGFVRALLGPLKDRFGGERLFKDTDSIPPGQDFVKVIEGELQSCKVVLAVIGNKWVTVEDKAHKRRLDNPNDYLRLEVATALKNDQVVVIPVLVEGAVMPTAEDLPEDLKQLARRNATQLSDSRWDTDVERLIQVLERICNEPTTSRKKRVVELPPEDPVEAPRPQPQAPPGGS